MKNKMLQSDAILYCTLVLDIENVLVMFQYKHAQYGCYTLLYYKTHKVLNINNLCRPEYTVDNFHRPFAD